MDHLRAVTAAILESLGVGVSETRLAADVLLAADMRGISTHGLNFLPMLADRIERGLLCVPTKLTVLGAAETTTHLDGGNGLGQTAAAEGMRAGIAAARRFGIGLSLIRNTNHIGLLAYYPLMAVAEGMIGFCACNGAAAVAPWGGTVPFFGTNPIAVAAPGGSETPVVLDMSTAVVARGKIRRAARMKERIPLGWALDERGAPTTDPEAAMKGTLLPIGGPKGYGLAFFVDLICGLLSGSKYGRDVKTFHKPRGPTGVGVAMAAVDISRFMPLDEFGALIDEHVKAVRNSNKAQGNDRIYLPGEIEAEKERDARTRGVELDASVIQAVGELLKKRGLSLRIEDGAISQ